MSATSAPHIGYIPNPGKIKVGYGWRLLAPGEPVAQYDESRLDGESNWVAIKGRNPGPVQHRGLVYRRRIQSEPGYVGVAENEAPGRAARYIWHHYATYSGRWDNVLRRHDDCPSEWDGYDTDGLLITRPIATAPSDTLEDQIIKAQQELKRLERARKERDEIKVGDWVVNIHPVPHKDLQPHGVYRVRVSGNDLLFDGSETTLGKWNARKATPEEVAAHLAAQEIVVTVNGVRYTASFHEGFVQFGCAKIDNRLILAAHSFMQTLQSETGSSAFMTDRGNRKPESVKIGVGEFDRDTLAKLVKRIKD